MQQYNCSRATLIFIEHELCTIDVTRKASQSGTVHREDLKTLKWAYLRSILVALLQEFIAPKSIIIYLTVLNNTKGMIILSTNSHAAVFRSSYTSSSDLPDRELQAFRTSYRMSTWFRISHTYSLFIIVERAFMYTYASPEYGSKFRFRWCISCVLHLFSRASILHRSCVTKLSCMFLCCYLNLVSMFTPCPDSMGRLETRRW